MKLSRWIDAAVAILGTLSFLSLIGFFLALHDIWWDYASPAVWAHAGQPLPPWYSPGNRTPGEWGVMQVGFVVLVAFHVLLCARYLMRTLTATRE